MEVDSGISRQALNAKEVATYLGISRSSAYNLLNSTDNGFPAIRIRTGSGRGSLRVMKSALDHWLENQRIKDA